MESKRVGGQRVMALHVAAYTGANLRCYLHVLRAPTIALRRNMHVHLPAGISLSMGALVGKLVVRLVFTRWGYCQLERI